MTLQAERDRLAGMCGWERQTARINGGKLVDGWIRGDDLPLVSHPFPPNDLAALAAAWPEGWYLGVEWCDSWEAEAWPIEGGQSFLKQATTEYEARLRLTLAVLEADNPPTLASGRPKP